MRTLYELLGALPQDDAESLRAAFRRAVKGAHPDLRPGDPEAALKFREIVRANEILGDAEQRAVYDNLLELARLDESTASQRNIGARSTRLVSALVALFGASVGTVGFLLLMHMSVAEIGAGHLTRSRDTFDEIIQPGTKGADLDTKVAPGAASRPTMESVMANVLAGRNLAVGETKSLDGEISVSGQNDFDGRIADLGQPNRMYLPSYIDDRVIFFRHQKFHGFVDTARTKTPSRAKYAPTITAPRIKQAASWATPARRGAGQDLSRESFAKMAR